MTLFTRRRAFITLSVVLAAKISYPLLKNLYYVIFRPNYWNYLKFSRHLKHEIARKAAVPNSAVVSFPFEQKTEIAETQLSEEQNRVSVGLIRTIEAKIKSATKTNDPFLPPFDTGIFIMNLSKTHCLIFNKFQVTKNHLLVITRVFEAQTEPLTEGDLIDTYNVMRIHEGFAFFNSDTKAGASQRHKHLQVVPYSQFSTPYLTKIQELVADHERNAIEIDPVNNLTFIFFPFFAQYKYSLVRFREHNPVKETSDEYRRYLYMVYTRSRKQAGIENLNASFNIIFSKNWMLIVARKAEKVLGKVSLNSLAFIGSLVTGSEEKYQVLKGLKPSQVYSEVLVDKNDQNEYSMIKE